MGAESQSGYDPFSDESLAKTQEAIDATDFSVLDGKFDNGDNGEEN